MVKTKKRTTLVILLKSCLISLLLFVPKASFASVTDHVDVFVGTEGDHGQLYPGATLPFGLIKLSPDTVGSGHAGYDYADTQIRGFSHTRLGGVGCKGAGGDVCLKPALGNTVLDEIDKSSEKGTPGFYSVAFKNGIRADLTVSYRAGFHRYTFPSSSDDLYIRVDPSQSFANSLGCCWTEMSKDTIVGHSQGRNVCGKGYYKLYYAVQFDRDVADFESNGKAVWCRFAPEAAGGTVIQAKVGISPVSIEQAVAECENDIAGWDFDATREKAESTWEAVLGKIEIPNVTPELEEFRDLFYTCLYRCYLLPHNVTSTSGTYRMPGNEETCRHVGEISPDFIFYSGWSVWDDYRKFSLISLMEPDIAYNITRSIIEWFKAGYTPAWAEGYWPCPSVRNEFVNTVLLDAYLKGLVDYDIDGAYAGLISSVQGNEQVEKPYQYYIVMRFAELLGKTEDAKAFRKKAVSYQKYWAASQVDGEGNVRGFFTSDGQPVPQGRVNRVDAVFYEGNLWHYRFFVPHDIQGLANLRGSRRALADDLEYYFSTHQHMPLNEPPLAYPFLFNYLGRAHRTQYWSRVYITDEVKNIYHNHGKFKSPVERRAYEKKPAGWLPTMDDDTGAMSSQFVFSALGLYPASMGDPYYVIGSPLFPEVILHLQGGDFVIRAKDASLDNKYIQSADLDGEKFDKTWISHEELKKGGILSLVMHASPNMQWGSSPDSLPPSLSGPDCEK